MSIISSKLSVWSAVESHITSPMIPVVLKMSVDHASEGEPYLSDTFETKSKVQLRPVIPVIRCRSDSAMESIAIVPSSMYAWDEDAESTDLQFWLVVTTRTRCWTGLHLDRPSHGQISRNVSMSFLAHSLVFMYACNVCNVCYFSFLHWLCPFIKRCSWPIDLVHLFNTWPLFAFRGGEYLLLFGVHPYLPCIL